jgi:predicted 3-demethylubiquinone-9 3-methyltransferase (glyoxalase superfamily)
MRSPVDLPGGPAGSMILVEFTLAGSPYIALNASGFTFTEAVSFMIACEDQAEIDRLWEALTADGGEEVACGWLKDRWGVSWQITPTRLMELINDPDPDRARRAMEAMMTMIKIDIAAVERAAEGA